VSSKRDEAREQQAEGDEEARLKRREQLLEEEYAHAEKLGGEVAVQQVDDEMQALGAETLYDSEFEDDAIRLASRVTAQSALASENAVDTFAVHAWLDEAIKRGPGRPGSSWNDEERAKWERDLEQTAVDAFDQELGTHEQAITRAADSMRPKRGFMDDFNAEIDKLPTRPEHHERELKENAEARWREG
jgi:hypothetical protein